MLVTLKTLFTLKTKTYKYLLFLGIFIFLVACSTKKNTFLSRNSHALSTEYNILYNGGIALDKGISDLKSQYKDNFWEILPVERMQVSTDGFASEKTKNANFERAEEKATKAIQKHAMNIQGSEKNPQMDEAHLLLGKSRYYDQRFVPALEAFNYVLYKYPYSDKIHEIKIWREKTNMRMDNDELAINNLRRLLKEIEYKDQIFADAHATLAQAFINVKEKDSAVAKLKIAIAFTKLNEEKARYRFILGQLYEQLGYKDSAFAAFQEIIDMKRKSSRNYVIQAHAKQAFQLDVKKGDTIAFLKKFDKLLADRENRPFLDVLNHQLGLFYEKANQPDTALKFYNQSLKLKKEDQYLQASNYRNIAEIKFNKSLYEVAGKYYDSTLVALNPKTREAMSIKKKRENLVDVIKYETLVHKNDSILSVVAMSDVAKEQFYKKHIDKLIAEDEAKQKKADEKAKLDAIKVANAKNAEVSQAAPKPLVPASSNQMNSATFYFYNPTTVAYGKVEFKKKWGNRTLGENWRVSKSGANATEEDPALLDENLATTTPEKEGKPLNEKYTVAFYTKQLPTNRDTIANLIKDRNFAYYQLGSIYKEKFKEYARATNKLETLLFNKPEERLVLPTMYNLYKIYELVDKSKAAEMKLQISQLYPNSRYAQIINNTDANTSGASSPEATFSQLYKDYENGLIREVYAETNLAIEQFTGEDILPKLEFLKANLLAKLQGLSEYKKHLNHIALTYPNSKEGKEAEHFLKTRIPYLESLTFNSEPPMSWKIVYQANDLKDKSKIALIEKLSTFIKDQDNENITLSTDLYTLDQNFIVVHGFKSKEGAANASIVLKEIKEYKVEDTPCIISNENYKIVQMKKLFQEYVTENWLSKPLDVKARKLNPTNTSEPEKSTSVTKEAVKNALNNSQPEAKATNATDQNKTSQSNPPGAGMNTDSLPDRFGPPAPAMQPAQTIQPGIKK